MMAAALPLQQDLPPQKNEGKHLNILKGSDKPLMKNKSFTNRKKLLADSSTAALSHQYFPFVLVFSGYQGLVLQNL